ncbi:MAG: serine protease [Bacteriovoracia bacterium]
MLKQFALFQLLLFSFVPLWASAEALPYGYPTLGWTPEKLEEYYQKQLAEKKLSQTLQCGDLATCNPAVARALIRVFNASTVNFNEANCTASLFEQSNQVIMNRHCLPPGLKPGDGCLGLIHFAFPAKPPLPFDLASCKKVLTVSHEKDDYAIFELTKPMPNRTVPPIRTNALRLKGPQKVTITSVNAPAEIGIDALDSIACRQNEDSCKISAPTPRERAFTVLADKRDNLLLDAKNKKILGIRQSGGKILKVNASEINAAKLNFSEISAPSDPMLEEIDRKFLISSGNNVFCKKTEDCEAGVGFDTDSNAAVAIERDIVFIPGSLALPSNFCWVKKFSFRDSSGKPQRRHCVASSQGSGFTLIKLNQPIDDLAIFSPADKSATNSEARMFAGNFDNNDYIDDQTCEFFDGVIAIPGREERGMRHLELRNCKIGPGNSGSPIYSEDGALVGLAKGQINQRLFLELVQSRYRNDLFEFPPCWHENRGEFNNIGVGTSLDWFENITDILNAKAAPAEERPQLQLGEEAFTKMEAAVEKWKQDRAQTAEWTNIKIRDGAYPGIVVVPRCIKGAPPAGTELVIPYFVFSTDLDFKPLANWKQRQLDSKLLVTPDGEFAPIPIYEKENFYPLIEFFPNKIPACTK